MISQPLPNFKGQFSQKEKVGSYDNIALNQRYSLVSWIRLLETVFVEMIVDYSLM